MEVGWYILRRWVRGGREGWVGWVGCNGKRLEELELKLCREGWFGGNGKRLEELKLKLDPAEVLFCLRLMTQ